LRAVILDSVPSAPVVGEVDAPRPQAGEVLVKVVASSMNGFDAATAAGYLQGMMEHRFPLVIGKDFAGTVEALGEGVDAFAVGDAVFGVVMKPFLGTGSLAQYVAVPADSGIVPIPEGLSVRDAGALGLAGAAAMDSVNALAPDKTETVLISGATGGVGALAVQMTAARGARVIATARPGAEADFVSALTDTDVDLVDFTGDLDAQVRALAPNGVDTVPASGRRRRPTGRTTAAGRADRLHPRLRTRRRAGPGRHRPRGDGRRQHADSHRTRRRRRLRCIARPGDCHVPAGTGPQGVCCLRLRRARQTRRQLRLTTAFPLRPRRSAAPWRRSAPATRRAPLPLICQPSLN
jgi:Alcohol dehydrogenase GroES-like domain